MVVDALLGWPSWLFARIGHPVTWLGRLISAIDTAWNRASDPPAFRRAAGLAASARGDRARRRARLGLQSSSLGWIQIVLVGVLAWPLVAFRSLTTTLLPSQIPCGPATSTPHARRLAHRRPRSRGARRGRHRARGDREPRRECLRRHRRAGVLGRAVRPARHFGLQGDQHAGLHDRPSHRTPRSLRLGRGAHRRCRQFHSGAADRIVCSCCWRHGDRGAVVHDAGCAPSSLAQCRLAGSSHGGRAWCAASGPRIYRRQHHQRALAE